MGKSLTKGQPAQSSNTPGHEISLHGVGERDASDHRSSWPQDVSMQGVEWEGCGGWEGHGGVGVNLTKVHPAQSSTKCGHEMSLHRRVGWDGHRGRGVAKVWGM